MSRLIFVDVEATGKSPYGGTMTEFGAVDYKTRETYHGQIWQSVPDPENPAKPVITGDQLRSEVDVMTEFADWLKKLGKSRPIFVSDNPAYDWQWINYYFDKCGMENPFGHSGRRISDYYAGLVEDFMQTQAWKKLRITEHTHNPVDDAMGNVEAFERLQKGERP